MSKKIYLASPYGFSPQQEERLLPTFVGILSELGADVWEPFARNKQSVDFGAKGWAYRVGQNDIHAVISCDGIFAIVNGNPPDEGVMVELGAATALQKKIFLFRDDRRNSNDCESYPLNTMIFSGLPERGWEDYFYRSVDEIRSPNKAVARWLTGTLE